MADNLGAARLVGYPSLGLLLRLTRCCPRLLGSALRRDAGASLETAPDDADDTESKTLRGQLKAACIPSIGHGALYNDRRPLRSRPRGQFSWRAVPIANAIRSRRSG